MAAGTGRRLLRRLRATVGLSVLCLAVSCSVDVSTSEVEPTLDPAARAERVDEDLEVFEANGWHLFTVEAPAGSDPADLSTLGLDLPQEPSGERADHTLVLVSVEGDPQRWVIVGSGGESATGPAALLAVAVDESMRSLTAVEGFEPTSAFTFSAASHLGIDLQAERSTTSVGRSLLLLVLVMGVVVFAAVVLLNRWFSRHAAPIRAIGSLKDGERAVIEGTVLCEDPMSVSGFDGAVVCADQVVQRMKKTQSKADELEENAFFTRQMRVTTVTEHGWEDHRHSVSGTLFRVADDTGEIWVDPAGASVDAYAVAATERVGDRREVLRVVPVGAVVAVRGTLRQHPNGARAMSGASSSDRKGFAVSVNGARGLSAAGRIGTVGRLVTFAVLVGLPLAALIAWG